MDWLIWWLLGSMAIGFYAASKGYSAAWWTLFSTILTPIAGIWMLYDKPRKERAGFWVIPAFIAICLASIPMLGVIGITGGAISKAQERKLKEHRGDIFAQINSLRLAGNPMAAYEIANNYYAVKDPEFKKLYALVKAQSDKVEEQELLAELKTIPASNLYINHYNYKRLVTLRPDNETYKNKLRYYEQKLKGS
jgi:hypothetical protein